MKKSVINGLVFQDESPVEGSSWVQQSSAQHYTIMCDHPLGDPESIRDWVKIFNSAGPGDIINMYFNGPGGNLFTCIELLALMSNTEATTVGHLMGEACSAHSFLFLACDDWVVNRFTSLMLHSWHGGAYGSGLNVQRQANAVQKTFESMCSEIYYPFLTKEEINEVINNKDKYILAPQIIKRLEGVAKFRDAQDAQEQEAMKASVLKALQEQQAD